MAIQLDFTNVETMNFEPVPAGTYHCSVAGVKPKVASTGSNMLEWVMQIETGDFAGRRLFLNTILSEKSLWKTKLCLQALGYTEEELAGNFDLDPAELAGLECLVVAEQREYEGQVRNDVARFEPIHEDDGDDWEEPSEDLAVLDAIEVGDPPVEEAEEEEPAVEVEEAAEEPVAVKVTKTGQVLLDEYDLTAEEVAEFFDDGKALTKAKVQAYIAENFEADEEA